MKSSVLVSERDEHVGDESQGLIYGMNYCRVPRDLGQLGVRRTGELTGVESE